MKGSIVYFPIICSSGNHFKGDKYSQLGSLFGQRINLLILANALSSKHFCRSTKLFLIGKLSLNKRISDKDSINRTIISLKTKLCIA